LDRTEFRRHKYALIRNAYGDDKLAQEYRDAGAKRIYAELGIDISVKVTPVLKEIDHTKDAYYQRKLNKFQYATDIGHSVPEAKRLTSYSNRKIKSSLDMVRIIKRTLKTDNYTNRKKRILLWESWSTSGKSGRGNMPPEIDRMAREFNREQKYDDYAKFGYYYAFYIFVENYDLESVKRLMEPDKFLESVKYRTMIRVPA